MDAIPPRATSRSIAAARRIRRASSDSDTAAGFKIVT
jgi:hypothetical protein